jgi:hypothetical protein
MRARLGPPYVILRSALPLRVGSQCPISVGVADGLVFKDEFPFRTKGVLITEVAAHEKRAVPGTDTLEEFWDLANWHVFGEIIKGGQLKCGAGSENAFGCSVLGIGKRLTVYNDGVRRIEYAAVNVGCKIVGWRVSEVFEMQDPAEFGVLKSYFSIFQENVCPQLSRDYEGQRNGPSACRRAEADLI